MAVETLQGHRCLRLPAARPAGKPPLVVLGGTAQTVHSWVGHVQALSRDRDLLILELRGQGPKNPALPPLDVSLPAQAADVAAVLESPDLGWRQEGPVDLVGFSFGARVALAVAAAHPGIVRRCVLTSVAADRGPVGRLVLKQWEAILGRQESRDSLEAFAWASILNTHAPDFLARNEPRVSGWVSLVAEGNTREGLLAILEQTHVEDPDHPDHALRHAAHVRKAGSVQGAVICGGKDIVCNVATAGQLAETAGWWAQQPADPNQHQAGAHDSQSRTMATPPPPPAAIVFPQCGHAVPLEDPTRWRKAVLEFLDEGTLPPPPSGGGSPEVPKQ